MLSVTFTALLMRCPTTQRIWLPSRKQKQMFPFLHRYLFLNQVILQTLLLKLIIDAKIVSRLSGPKITRDSILS